VLELTLVRHASTALNEQRRYQGWIDPPLSPRGCAEALQLRERLRDAHFDRIVYSDLRRCVDTAALALPGVSAEADARLRELHFGAWDGCTYNECEARDAARLHAWTRDPIGETPPGGEPFDRFRQRVDGALDALPREGSALIIAHGGPIRRILARALGLEWSRVVLMQLSPCGITRLALHPDGGHLRCWNDTAHISP
jgi:broad specificity phosphatase PhoE